MEALPLGGGTGNLESFGGGVINNNGTFNVQNNQFFDYLNSGNVLVFNNNGSFIKSAGTGTATVEAIFNNSGLLEAQTGSVSLVGGGSAAGEYKAGAAGRISFAGGTHTAAGLVKFSGAGTNHLAGATLDVDGAGTVTGFFEFASGTLSGIGTLTVSNRFDWLGGTMTDGGTFAVANGVNLNLAGAGNKRLQNGRIIQVDGIAVWSGTGNIEFFNGCTWNNAGVFDVQNNQFFDYLSSGSVMAFNNTGTFVKSSGIGTTTIEAVFNNSGTLAVQSGTVTSTGGGTGTGEFNVNAVSALNFTGGTYGLSAPAIFTGAGTNRVAGGTVNVTDQASILGNFELASGVVGGVGTITVSTKFVWTGGTIQDAGILSVPTGGLLTITGSANKRFQNGRVIEIAGTAVWSGAGNIEGLGGGGINISGLFEIQNDQFFDYLNSGTTPAINNTGTLRKTGGAGTTTVEFVLNNNGVVDVQTGVLHFPAGANVGTGSSFIGNGLTRLASGTFNFNGNLNIQNLEFAGGTMTGTNTVTGKLRWTGGTMDGPGMLTISQGAELEISGSVNKLLQDVFIINNSGTITWLGTGNLQGLNGPIINNSGLMLVQNDRALDYLNSGTVPAINNSGTFRKTSPGTTTTEFALNNTGLVDLQAGTLSCSSALSSSSSTFQLAAGTLVDFPTGGHTLHTGTAFVGPGTFRVSGASITLSVGHTVEVGSQAVFDFSSGTLIGSGSIVVSNIMTWTGGTLTGTGGTLEIPANGSLFISGASGKRLQTGWTMAIAGQTTWSGTGNIEFSNGATWNNSGTFIVQNNQFFDYLNSGAVMAFNNSGSFVKSAGTGTTTVEAVFNNTGVLSAQSGTISLTGGGTSTGELNAAGVASLAYAGGTFGLNAPATITGDGTNRVSGGTVNVNDQASVLGNFELSSGILGGTGTLNVSTKFLWTGGTMQDAGTLRVATGGLMAIPGTAHKRFQQGRIIDIAGTAVWSGTGNFEGFGGGSINISGLFEIQNDQFFDFLNSGFTPAINNTGILRKTGGTGTTTVEFVLNNNGIVDVQAGVLHFPVGANIGTGSSFIGNGLTRLASGTFNLNGNVNSDNLEFTGGSLIGTNILTGKMRWTAGTMDGPGMLTIAAAGELELSGASAKTFQDGFVINNNGKITWLGTGNLQGFNGPVINNNGLFDAHNDQSLDYLNSGAVPVINNSGLFKKSAGTNTTTLEAAFDNLAGGKLLAQIGTVALAMGGASIGEFSADTGALITYTGGTHSMNTGATFTGGGIHRILGGTVDVDGNATVLGIAELVSGTLGGVGILTVSNRFNWTSGTMTEGGTLRVAIGGTLELTGAGHKRFQNGRIIEIAGTGIWNGTGNWEGLNGGAINVTGLLDIQNDQFFDYLNIGSVPVINNSGTLRKSGLTGQTTVEFDLNNSGTVDVLSGVLNFPSGANFNGGSTFTGAGITRMAGGTFQLNGSINPQNLEFAGGTLVGNNLLTGKLTWTGGTMAGPGQLAIGATGELELSGNAAKRFQDGWIIQNGGRITWKGAGNFEGYNSPVLNNTGVFDLQTDSTLDYLNSGGFPIINNSGDVKKTGGTGTTLLEALFNNQSSGHLIVQSGSITLAAGGTSSGEFHPEANGTINFTGGTHTINTGGLFAGEGLSRIVGGSVDVDGDATVLGTLELASGTLGGGGVLTVSTLFNWTGGTMAEAGTVRAAPGGLLNITGGNSKRFQDGRIIEIAGAATWSGTGNIEGYNGSAIHINGGLFEIQNDRFFDFLDTGARPVINNNGTLRKTGGAGVTTVEFVFNNSGVVDIRSGTLSFPVGANFSNGSSFTGAGVAKMTSGTFRITGGFFAESLEFAGGTMTGTNVLSGKLKWTGGTMAGPGSLEIGAAGELELSGAGAKRFQDGWIIDNHGKITWLDIGNFEGFNSPVINNAGLIDIRNDRFFNFLNTGGLPVINNAGIIRKRNAGNTTTVEFALNNTGTIDITSGFLSFPAGAFFDSGSVFTGAGETVMSGGTFTVRGEISSQNLEFVGGTLFGTNVIHGKVKWIGGTMVGPGGMTIASDGELELNGGPSKRFQDGWVIHNNGTLTWLGSGNIEGFNGPALNNNGLFQIGSDRIMNYLNTGAVPIFTNNGIVRKSGASGTTTIEFTFVNNGTLDLQSGRVSISGSYSPAPSSSLTVAIGGLTPGTEFGQLSVVGAASLQGTLNIVRTNSFYPAAGNSFPVVTYGSRSGIFTAFTGVDFANGRGLVTNYNASSLTVVASSVPVHCIPPGQGLVGWWPGEGNASDIWAGNHGSLALGTVFTTGLDGQAFNGPVTVPNTAALNFASASPMSAELWVFRTGTSPSMQLLGKQFECDTNSVNYQILLSTNPAEGLSFGGSAGRLATGIDLPMNTWTHVASTFDGSTLRLYVNGELAGAVAGTLGPLNTGPLLIGGLPDCQAFPGLTDEIAIYNRALSPGEVAEIFIAGNLGKCQPSLPVVNLSVASAGYITNEPPRILDANAALTGTANFSAMQVRARVASGLLSGDRLSVRHQGTGAQQIGVAGAAVSYSGTVIGSLAGGFEAPLLITLNGSATGPAVVALLRNLGFDNTSPHAMTGIRTVGMAFIDESGAIGFESTMTVDVTGAVAFEGDAAPRPNGSGSLSIQDWTQVGRYAAGLDTVSDEVEFQRVDCAPRRNGATFLLGDGAITIADWVQAGRYAIALDPATSVGGPTGPAGQINVAAANPPRRSIPAGPASVLRLRDPGELRPGRSSRLVVEWQAGGGENAAGFSIQLDPAVLTFVEARLLNPRRGEILLLNPSQSIMGRVGFAVGLPINDVCPPGEVVELEIVVLPAASEDGMETTIEFGDNPVRREVVDSLTAVRTATYAGLTVPIAASDAESNPSIGPVLAVKRTNGGLSIQVTGVAGLTYRLEVSNDLKTWTTLRTITPMASIFELPITGSEPSFGFFRVAHDR